MIDPRSHMKDEHFVAEAYHASYRRLVGQMFALSGDLAGAEDVVQEAFVRALDHVRVFRRADNPEAWLSRVAINIQRSRWRRLKRYAGLQPRLVERGTPPDVRAETLDLLEVLAGLPAGQREAIVLHHLTDLPVDEVAAALGVPVGTVKSRLSRARVALARALDDEEHHA
jgi:RNA polymerase sigma-70 factor (ECF subfamily)